MISHQSSQTSITNIRSIDFIFTQLIISNLEFIQMIRQYRIELKGGQDIS